MLWDKLISGVKKHIHALKQNNPAYYGICLTAWWDYTHPGSNSLTSHLMAKLYQSPTCTSVVQHFIQSSFEGPNTWEWKISIFSHEQVYWWWMRHVAASTFWLHSLTTLVPRIFCTCFVHIGPQPNFTPTPTLCSIPLTCTQWIKNPSNACVIVDTKFCIFTNATQASALTQILITTHICKIMKSDY
jgi:hypothetical protein